MLYLNHLNNVSSNWDVFVGCSEISISVIVKHVHNIRIIRAFVWLGGLVKFSSAWATEKIAGLWFARGDQYLGWHYANNLEFPFVVSRQIIVYWNILWDTTDDMIVGVFSW